MKTTITTNYLKKGLALAMAAFMATSLLPTAAFAAGNDLQARFEWDQMQTPPAVRAIVVNSANANTTATFDSIDAVYTADQVNVEVFVDADKSVAATCTTNGTQTYYAVAKVSGMTFYSYEAANEDERYATVEASATGHVFDESKYVITKDPTHSENGSAIATCEVCGAKETVTLPMIDHTFGDGVVERAATKDQPGVMRFTCTGCDYSYTASIPYVDRSENGHTHVYAETGTVIKEATCSEDGIMVVACTEDGCSATKEVAIPAAHQYDMENGVYTPATCSEYARTEYTCTECGDVLVVEDVEGGYGAHSFGEEPVEVPATCELDGYLANYCTECDKLFPIPNTTIPAGHHYGPIVTKEATCTEDGSVTRTCELCGKVKTVEVIKATGHDFGQWIETVAPTYTEKGEETRTCSVCGETETREVSPLPLDGHTHDYVETDRVEATCENDGLITETCSICGETRTETIAAIGHDWNAPTWEWAQDHSTATATFVCKHDDSHVVTLTASIEAGSVTVATREATTVAEGQKAFNATVSLDGVDYDAPRAVELIPVIVPVVDPSENNNNNNSTSSNTSNGGSSRSSRSSSAATTAPVTTIADEEVPLADLPLLFADVQANAYYASAVKWAINNGITTGTTETSFAPDLGCTRAQFMTFLYRAAGSPDVGDLENIFSDVPANKYYTNAILWAVNNGITTGVKDGTFAPNAIMTRAEAVTFLHRYANTNGGDASVFADVADGKYYTEAVGWAVENGITSGTSATTFSPKGQVTRAQVVTFLARMFETA